MNPRQSAAALDYIYRGQGGGDVAHRLLAANMNPEALRPVSPMVANATLRKDEWKQMDAALLPIARQRLVAVQDLISRGLTYNLANAMGTTVLEFEKESDLEAAEIAMDAVTKGNEDRPEFQIGYLPLPIAFKDFSYNIRVLNASRTLGRPLDVTTVEMATRKVSDKVEDMLMNGASTYKFGSGTLYGYTDFPDRNTVTLAQDWDASGKTAVEVLDDVKSLKQALIDDSFYGPYVLYVPTAYETKLDEDYSTSTSVVTTIRERILQVGNIEAVTVNDTLSANNVVLVQMTSDVVRLVVGMQPTVVEWDTMGGLKTNFKVMAILVPQLRSDYDLKCGIAHLS